MRWIERRCVSQSSRFALVVCAYVSFSVSVSANTLQQSPQQSSSAVLFGTTQSGKRLWLIPYNIHYFKYLKYFMSVQIYILETIKSPETNFNLKKMKVVSLRLLKYYAHLLLLVITSQHQVFIRTIERKVQKPLKKIFYFKGNVFLAAFCSACL